MLLLQRDDIQSIHFITQKCSKITSLAITQILTKHVPVKAKPQHR